MWACWSPVPGNGSVFTVASYGAPVTVPATGPPVPYASGRPDEGRPCHAPRLAAEEAPGRLAVLHGQVPLKEGWFLGDAGQGGPL